MAPGGDGSGWRPPPVNIGAGPRNSSDFSYATGWVQGYPIQHDPGWGPTHSFITEHTGAYMYPADSRKLATLSSGGVAHGGRGNSILPIVDASLTWGFPSAYTDNAAIIQADSDKITTYLKHAIPGNYYFSRFSMREWPAEYQSGAWGPLPASVLSPMPSSSHSPDLSLITSRGKYSNIDWWDPHLGLPHYPNKYWCNGDDQLPFNEKPKAMCPSFVCPFGLPETSTVDTQGGNYYHVDIDPSQNTEFHATDPTRQICHAEGGGPNIGFTFHPDDSAGGGVDFSKNQGDPAPHRNKYYPCKRAPGPSPNNIQPACPNCNPSYSDDYITPHKFRPPYWTNNLKKEKWEKDMCQVDRIVFPIGGVINSNGTGQWSSRYHPQRNKVPWQLYELGGVDGIASGSLLPYYPVERR